MPQVRETTISVGGHPVRCLQGGSGPILLFLHGMAGLRSGAPFLDRLAERYRLIAPEHPGFGETDELAWIGSVRDVATHYTRLLRETLRGEPVFVVGHSLGGWVAVELAFANPEPVRKQVLVAPAGLRGETEAVDPFMVDDEQLAALAVAESAAAPPAPVPSDRSAIRNRQMTARLAWSPRFADPTLPSRLNQVAAPTLLLWGTEDRIVPPDRCRGFQEHLPDARAATIAGAGHLPMIEAADAFVDEVAAFLTD